MSSPLITVPNVPYPDMSMTYFRHVKALLEKDHRWLHVHQDYPLRAWLAFDETGMACRPTSQRAKQWTLEGAIYLVACHLHSERYKQRYAVGLMESAVYYTMTKRKIMDEPSPHDSNHHENTDHAALMAFLGYVVDDLGDDV